MEFLYACGMSKGTRPIASHTRLQEIATHLRAAFSLPAHEEVHLSDLVAALGNNELREIYNEIQSLQQEQLDRLERILSRHAANDA